MVLREIVTAWLVVSLVITLLDLIIDESLLFYTINIIALFGGLIINFVKLFDFVAYLEGDFSFIFKFFENITAFIFGFLYLLDLVSGDLIVGIILAPIEFVLSLLNFALDELKQSPNDAVLQGIIGIIDPILNGVVITTDFDLIIVRIEGETKILPGLVDAVDLVRSLMVAIFEGISDIIFDFLLLGLGLETPNVGVSYFWKVFLD